MNILELNFERTWRGGERQTIYNISGFLKEGHSVTVLCRKGFPLEQHAIAEGCSVRSFSHIGGVIWFLITHGHQFDVVHAQTSHVLTYCLLTKPFHRRAVVLSRRVDFIPKGRLTRLKYRLTDQIVAVSKAVKNIVVKFSDRKDIAVISDAAEPEKISKDEALKFLESRKIPLRKFTFGTVAALVPHKDPMTMVAAVSELRKTMTDFVFLHFGDGELKGQLDEKIAEYGLQDVYFHLGFVENVHDFFAVLDVFVMSSQEEGLGSSVLDAFLYKVPVVTTDAGGLAELLEDGRGYLCPKRSPKALAEAMQRMVFIDESEKEVMRQKALDYARVRHSVSFIAKEYLKVFTEKIRGVL